MKINYLILAAILLVAVIAIAGCVGQKKAAATGEETGEEVTEPTTPTETPPVKTTGKNASTVSPPPPPPLPS